MAKLKSGINGPISGKVGNVVGSSWNGIDYIKSSPVRKEPPTEGELNHRFNFKLVQRFVAPINEFLKVGFKAYSPTNYGANAAKSLIFKNSLHRDGQNSSIDPSLVQMSYGSLGFSEPMEMELTEEKVIQFTWDSHIGSEMRHKDQVMLLAYDPTTGHNKMNTSGQFRSNGSDSLDMKHLPAGTYHIYAAFVAEDRSRQSDSRYLGAVEID